MKMPFVKERAAAPEPRYPGTPEATDGTAAIVTMETAASEAAGAYPITPSTQMGEGWAMAVAQGATNVNGRRLLFFEPEGEHAAAGVTAGMSMVGLRATNFSSGQGIAYMHESLYAAVGKRLTYVLNIAARAMTKHALNVHAGHDDYHAVDDTGFFQLFARDVQAAADLNLIAHRVAELSLNPGIVAQDGFLTSHVIETMRMPERALVKEYLGDPSDLIDSPTPAQRLVFGERRRRIPELFDVDYPAMLGTVQNQDSYAQGVAAQRPFYFDHVHALTERAMSEYAELTGRRYARAMGYRLADAEYVLAGMGSVVGNAQAVADWLRAERGLKVGVLDMIMFRPFPADLVASLLAGKKAVTVLERVDQPLAVDAPMLREIRSAFGKAVENWRAQSAGQAGRGGPWKPARGMDGYPVMEAPHAGLPGVTPEQVPDFFSAGFGFGSRDLQGGDLVAAVDNMLEGGTRRRQYYLGIDFIRRGTKLPKLEIWQQQLVEAYPKLPELALAPAEGLDLLPAGSIALRIHSVGGWGAITMGKNLSLTAFELAGLHVKANPKYGSEKKGQPTTFYATLSRDPIRINAELKYVDVVLSPDANVFRHSNPLAGLREGGVFVIQTDQTPEALWESFPAYARGYIRAKGIKVYALDGFAIASEESSTAELRYRMQGAAFMGAFFRTSPLAEREGLDEETLFAGIRDQMGRKFGKLGDRVVEDNVRVIRRGYDEIREVATVSDGNGTHVALPVAQVPDMLDVPAAEIGIGNPGRFFEQVCSIYGVGEEPIADPYAAISAIPAATSVIRDMTNIRFEVPDFVASRCTGCAQCWTQCPDAAIPGLVNSIEDLLDTAIAHARNRHVDGGNGDGSGRSLDRLMQVSKHLVKETRTIVEGVPFDNFGDALRAAYRNLVPKLDWDPEKRRELDDDFAAVYPILATFPLAKTQPFWDMPEGKEKGSGGLLSVTINPEACKGCNICVEVCPESALITVKQDEEMVEGLRRNWAFWKELPDTADRFVNIRDLEEGIGVLPSLLLRKDVYRSMVGGDGACMGCGEKTAVHLITSTIEALMQGRVEKFVGKIDTLIAGLDRQARDLLSADADLDLLAGAEDGRLDVPMTDETRVRLERYVASLRALKDLKWRYAQGPGGRGRAELGIVNSTGCSSVWGSSYPFNPYPFPWVNHLFQDAPSVAIGIFEGHMRKMGDNFAAVRRAEKLLDGSYDPGIDEPFFTSFDWRQFTDDEFNLVPPILAIGGDGAMLDIGFQNLSRLLASGKPIRVIVLDTQVYSNTGGQASTGTYTGQAADMSPYGAAVHGKTETRKELAYIAIAHRGAFVHQTSQASANHLIGGLIRGLQTRRPSVINVYTPCPVEHGLPDEWAPKSARLALESRAFPYLTYDPDGGSSIAACLSLDGNPSMDDVWPLYELKYIDRAGAEQTMALPVTIADWAATEGRFKKHFKAVPDDQGADDMVVFHEFVAMAAEDRDGKTPFIWTARDDRTLERLRVSGEIVGLAEERLLYWHQLREMAGLEVPDWVRDEIGGRLQTEFEAKLADARQTFEAKLEELKATYPRIIARRLAEGLVKQGNGTRTVADLLRAAESTPGLQPIGPDVGGLPLGDSGGNGGAPAGEAGAARPVGTDGGVATMEDLEPAVEAPAETEDAGGLAMEPYIETIRCTTCDECTNLNGRMFKYDANRQAYIADADAGTFRELVLAAERCPAGIIHPGTPRDRNEKDLEKWLKRAEPFN
ncbi:MAG TPA: 2-oxoacid:acceptor oxidoreductase family protein [Longimicrobiales bacterium]|nr:2-oxoacid:acceptor oxidoreductase family protein [Longimicrobiales bacterium]